MHALSGGRTASSGVTLPQTHKLNPLQKTDKKFKTYVYKCTFSSLSKVDKQTK